MLDYLDHFCNSTLSPLYKVSGCEYRQEFQHNFALALSDNRVWDYHGDYFVHRIVQNESSRKIIGLGLYLCFFLNAVDLPVEVSIFNRAETSMNLKTMNCYSVYVYHKAFILASQLFVQT